MGSKKSTILVTGIGAIIGYGILKSLGNARDNLTVIGLDKNQHIYSKGLCDVFIKKPEFEDNVNEYIDFWNEIIIKYNITAIFPSIDIDISFFNKHRAIFDKKIKLVLNDKDLIALCSDKLIFYDFLKKIDKNYLIPTILPISLEEAFEELGNLPYILKPRNGSGSQGIIKIENKLDFEYWTKKNKNYLLQKYVGSDSEEYTVGVFGLGDGNIHESIIILKRILSREGNTKQAKVVENINILKATKELSKILKPIGPTNFQFRIDENKIYLLEVNPRFSSSNSLRTLFGYNDTKMSIEYFLENKIPDKQNIKSGMAIRYLEDYLIQC
ncbi:ATP-grasp domain-containing protein [Aliarcobacter skirrowii]|uniref:ATP-grasp domain-containing protein n=1 Tax=Aliarcobacter skirrowii TaxID=28200 RepID=UPI0029A87235|nr:ATP-grasp domain-containing protein [Aliarcobacter skirrowii]MDX4012701.1 ATP-grasp domain-containing protein [Aliarcobacter skirrowii]